MTEQRADYSVPPPQPVPPVRVTRPAPRGTMRDVKRTHLSPAVAAFIAWCAEVVSTEVKRR